MRRLSRRRSMPAYTDAKRAGKATRLREMLTLDVAATVQNANEIENIGLIIKADIGVVLANGVTAEATTELRYGMTSRTRYSGQLSHDDDYFVDKSLGGLCPGCARDAGGEFEQVSFGLRRYDDFGHDRARFASVCLIRAAAASRELPSPRSSAASASSTCDLAHT